jgi:hypothetical protein
VHFAPPDNGETTRTTSCRSSILAHHRSTFIVQRSSFNVHRSTFIVQRSSFASARWGMQTSQVKQTAPFTQTSLHINASHLLGRNGVPSVKFVNKKFNRVLCKSNRVAP